MSHRNAPLTPEGRLRLVGSTRSPVAAEASVSRQCLGKWYARWREAGLPTPVPRSVSIYCDSAAGSRIVVLRKKKWSARRIVRELAAKDISISVATVTRWLHKLGVHRLDHLDVDGEPLRKPGKIIAHWPGHMIHIDVKKVGRIPDGGGWRIHGCQLRPGPRRSSSHRQGQSERRSTRLRLPTLRGRWVLPAGLHRGPRRRDREDRDRVPLSRPRLVHRPRRYPVHPDRDRQRLLLPRQRLHPSGVLVRLAASTDQALHAPAQRQGRALPADLGQRTALRPPLAQRSPPPRRDRHLEPALQLPSAPQRRWRQAPSLTPPDRRHQRTEQLRLQVARRAARARRWRSLLPGRR